MSRPPFGATASPAARALGQAARIAWNLPAAARRLGLRRLRERPVRTLFGALEFSPASIDFAEAMIETGQRLLQDFPLDRSSTVVDVGAHDGRWAHAIVERYGCSLHAYEPSPDAFALLSRALEGRAGARCHQAGLAGTRRGAVLDASGLAGASIYAFGPDRDRAPATPIQLLDAADELAAIPAPRIALLKLNVEGAEYEILERLLAAGSLARVDELAVQFHRWFPGAEARRAAIRARLESTHELLWDYPFVWERWRRRGGASRGA